MKAILQPFSQQTLGDLLKTELKNHHSWNAFQAAVAFAKHSGVQHISDELQEFVGQGGYVRMVVGIDQHGTSEEGLLELLSAIGDKGELWINQIGRAHV